LRSIEYFYSGFGKTSNIRIKSCQIINQKADYFLSEKNIDIYSETHQRSIYDDIWFYLNFNNIFNLICLFFGSNQNSKINRKNRGRIFPSNSVINEAESIHMQSWLWSKNMLFHWKWIYISWSKSETYYSSLTFIDSKIVSEILHIIWNFCFQ
jgi:hypothetical protein